MGMVIFERNIITGQVTTATQIVQLIGIPQSTTQIQHNFLEKQPALMNSVHKCGELVPPIVGYATLRKEGETETVPLGHHFLKGTVFSLRGPRRVKNATPENGGNSALSRRIERMRTEIYCLFAAIDLQCNSVILVLLIPYNFLFLIRMKFHVLVFYISF